MTAVAFRSKLVSINIPLNYPLENVFLVPNYYTRMASILAKCTLFDGLGSIYNKCKVMSLNDENDARIWEVLDRNSKHSWHIYFFHEGRLPLFDSDHTPIKPGIVQSLDYKDELCSLETLQSSYSEVIKRMINGWRKAEPTDNPPSFSLWNQQEFLQFIKDQPFDNESDLIFYMARRFSLQDVVKTDHDNGKLRLWIKHSAIEKVTNKMGFRIREFARL